MHMTMKNNSEAEKGINLTIVPYKDIYREKVTEITLYAWQGIYDEYKRRLGTKMFEEMIGLAENREGVMQIELEFIEGNARARHLYEKMGFRITGVHPNAIRLKDGTLLNNYTMIKEIKQ